MDEQDKLEEIRKEVTLLKERIRVFDLVEECNSLYEFKMKYKEIILKDEKDDNRT